MTDWPADKVERRKERTCVDCGNLEMVRSDNSSTRCRSCAGRKRGAIGLATIMARAEASEGSCETCGKAHRNARFCSRECKQASAPRVDRQCKCCGVGFSVLECALRTNASGNFCSRGCYERFLCRTEKVTGRGSQWRKIRQESICRAPFCAICGTRHSLQVHHIIPFRLTRNNAQSNLVPLCVKHHRWVETILVETEKFGFDLAARTAWAGMLRERQMATAAKLKELAIA